jgi:hypothetical protein
MNPKSIILLGLATAILASALVFDGVSHRHTATSNSAIASSASSNGTPPDSSNRATEAQPADQSPSAADNTTALDSGQDPAQDANAQVETDADAPNAPPDQPADADASQPAAPQPIIVPAGTTLTIRLGEELGSKISEAGQKFSATLDQDVVIRGQTVIPAGATVTGKVLSARPAGAIAGEANLQLKLTSVSTDSGRLSLATSVRSFGPKVKGKSKVGRFMKGLVKRAAGEEREVLLAQQSAYSFTLQRRLQIQ